VCPGPTDQIHIALRLSLIWLLLRPMGPWYVRAPLLLLSMLGLVSGPWLRAPAVWLVITFLVAVRLYVEWPLPDNHIYLLAYWCLGVTLALRFENPASQLAHTGRLLLGMVFALAVLWKAVLSPDFRDGRFFTVTMLTDDRFADAVQLFGGLSDVQLQEQRDLLTPPPGGAELLEPHVPQVPARVRALALEATWGTLAMETLAAVVWLAPVTRRALLTVRHGIVVLFCLTTYAFAPVAGFGWLLIVLGLSNCGVHDRWAKAVYVATYATVLLYAEVPWAALVLATS
jgi:hypothetical protein